MIDQHTPDLAGRQCPSIVECPRQRRSPVCLQPSVRAGLASGPVVERVGFKNLQELLRFQGRELGHGATLDERAVLDRPLTGPSSQLSSSDSASILVGCPISDGGLCEGRGLERGDEAREFLIAAAGSIPSVLADALHHRDRDVTACFGGLVDTRLHVTAPGEEVWVAIATQATDGRFVEERLRDVLFGLVLDAAEAELWEPRADWPSGELAWFEVARLGLREPPS